VSDDLPLRALAKKELSIFGVGSFSVLAFLRFRSMLSDDEYHRAIEWLTSKRFSFVSVSKEDIVWVLEKYRWLPTQEVGEFLDRALGRNTNDALSVALETLYEVWTRPLLQSTKQLISDLMLHSVTIGRNSGQVLTLFQIMNNRKSPIWTPAMAQSQSLLRSWTVRRRPVNSAPGPTTDRRSRRRSGLSIALPASAHVHLARARFSS
jgi:hypothetical protein